MNKFKATIGVEIHISLNTKTKMFSSSKNDFNDPPNTNISPIDVGYPGALPVLNKEAVIKAIKLAKALKMKINNVLYFDRKNYYYPDLPKGFQITQHEDPIAKNGKLKVLNKTINIERIHLEEDTAKSIHKNNKTYLNFNRSGSPLIEVVSKPEFSSGKEAAKYVQKIKEMVIFLKISDGKMEKGSLRADINISLNDINKKQLGTKVEIKNLNSISNIEKAIKIEIRKQKELLLKNEKIFPYTKRFDEKLQDTIKMRVKKESIDYKFFPEPNIPPIFLEKEFIDSIKINELSNKREKKYLNWNIPKEYVKQLISNLKMANYFDSIDYKDKNKLSKFFFAEIVSLANSKNLSVIDLKINPKEIVSLLLKVKEGKISGKHAKEIVPLLINNKKTVNLIIKEKNIKLISNENKILKMINEIINENKEFINKNKDRKERVSKFILGQLMKKSKGQVNPKIASKIVEKFL